MDDPHAVTRPGVGGAQPRRTAREPRVGRVDIGRQCAIAVMVSMTALVTFGALADEVVHHGPLTRLDVSLMLAFHHDATALGTSVFDVVTLIGSPRTVALIGVIVGVVLLVRRQRILAVGWIVTLLGGGVIDEVVKHAIQRPRPPYAAAHLTHMSFSFPSGHVVGSVVGYGMLAYLVLLRVPRRDVGALVALAAAALMLVIGFSRLYLGVHYFTDIAGGYSAAGCWLTISVTVTDVWYRRWHARHPGHTPSSHAPPP